MSPVRGASIFSATPARSVGRQLKALVSASATDSARAGNRSATSGSGSNGGVARAKPKAAPEEELPFAVYTPTANAEYWQAS